MPQDALDAPLSGQTAVDLLPGPGQISTSSLAHNRSGVAGVSPQSESFPAALRVQEGETVYDAAWYPLMNTYEPASCCFATTSRVRIRDLTPSRLLNMLKYLLINVSIIFL